MTNDYIRDGVGVTDPVLADSGAIYTPGISERRGGVTKYGHSGLKNMDAQSDLSQSVASTRRYDAWGNTRSTTGTWSGPFGHAGGFGYQSSDRSGLQLLGHRYYDSETGRFLTRDPIKDGNNWHAYGGGLDNPITSYDADGLKKAVIVTGGPYKEKAGGTDGAYPYFEDAAEKYKEYLESLGYTVVVLVEPTEEELASAIKDAEGLVFIGHGNHANNYGRLQGEPGKLASEKLTPGLINNARDGKKLEWLILESCHLGHKKNLPHWHKVAKQVRSHPWGMFPSRLVRDWQKVEDKLPKVIGGGAIRR